uniref:Transcriptional repressor Tup1 N-terminal domain-containing protein n=1 Tax=Compsopogon caeruleus TaxID=31354 RepID=A0A7S1XH44_9RHOD|mmetsp:Transcript_7867/g.15829  ORF Transcript_7867/g.15829 Transcript_7867/m.15829 type:complete len:624 (+) Transcript_7867:322-2193(+)|eukprot:CAMPEP_0184679408 /NCGR_PEP_ID=MMETSP0312-20130426/2241_1 /TAXON_ID=31354 /ORGANISM="Compsopogon coeruleus, Strain SAG 36.94" /LENGTH=623 /DNA_ID=CAMNT_0027128825 /DNA_START=225 /DNA_END=2096 /DNA_ORIENTATION=-
MQSSGPPSGYVVQGAGNSGPPGVGGGTVTSASSRFHELLEQVKVEFDSALQEGKSFRGIREEYNMKVEEQVAEISGMEQAICELERRFNNMKGEYEAEIARLKAQLQGGVSAPRPQANSFSQPTPAAPGPPTGSSAPASMNPPAANAPMPSQLPSSVQPSNKRTRGEPVVNSNAPAVSPAMLSSSTAAGPANMLSSVRATNGIMSPQGLVSMSSVPPTAASTSPSGMGAVTSPSATATRSAPPGNKNRTESSQPVRRTPGPGNDINVSVNAVAPVNVAPVNVNSQTRSEEDDYVVYQGRSTGGTTSNINIKLQNTFNHNSVVCCVRYSWNGLYLATGSNRCAHVLDATSGARIATFSKDDGTEPDANESNTIPDSYVRAVCFSPDGKWLITGAEDHVVKVWDVRNRTVKYHLQGHDADIYSVDASQDSSFIISGSGDKKAKIWSLQNGKLLTTLGGGDFGPTDGITSVSVSPTSHHVAAGSLDKIVRVWDVENGVLVRQFEGHHDSVYSVAFSPDGRSLLSGSLDKTLKLWDLAANQPSNQCRLSFTGHKDFVLSVAFSPNGRLLISGSKDRSVQFWDPRQSSMCLMLQGHKNSVISIAHSPTAKALATGSGDCRARTWAYTS